MIIWFTGLSGSGKTTFAKLVLKEIKKKINNFYHLDGDHFRSLMNNDLGFSLKDRDINAIRIINFVKSLDQQKINVFVSANLTSKKFRLKNKKMFKNYMEILLSVKKEILFKRDYKKVYKNKRNVVGKDIKFYTGTADIIIENNSSAKDLKKKALSIAKQLKKFKFH